MKTHSSNAASVVARPSLCPYPPPATSQSNAERILLYVYPGASSLAAHIALRWCGHPFDTLAVKPAMLRSASHLAINPASVVPALEHGPSVLTDDIAIHDYLHGRFPDAGLFGDGSGQQRAETLYWMMLSSSDMRLVFQSFCSPSFYRNRDDRRSVLQSNASLRLRPLLELVDSHLRSREWLTGFRSAADAYLYVVLRWAVLFGIEADDLQYLAAFKRRIEADPCVQAALEAEGLSPELAPTPRMVSGRTSVPEAQPCR
ncbi:glutathione S-transferase family protein [Pseudoxanthomonas sacheonensis]|uniref:Glutathione S-transferase n=1 Tax=Pseudoxanthomonas sacheonensis TaxID=443615 RepID=A0ABU1RTN3_9GAMM|nr:glutathione S-transferase N-terminal domain-containing protein [Pseudoxanthomonas sacheonensis]MDR6842146.1 glutathione S-transferase [Pseudoxanthomonas sacheonensis]